MLTHTVGPLYNADYYGTLFYIINTAWQWCVRCRLTRQTSTWQLTLYTWPSQASYGVCFVHNRGEKVRVFSRKCFCLGMWSYCDNDITSKTLTRYLSGICLGRNHDVWEISYFIGEEYRILVAQFTVSHLLHKLNKGLKFFGWHVLIKFLEF